MGQLYHKAGRDKNNRCSNSQNNLSQRRVHQNIVPVLIEPVQQRDIADAQHNAKLQAETVPEEQTAPVEKTPETPAAEPAVKPEPETKPAPTPVPAMPALDEKSEEESGGFWGALVGFLVLLAAAAGGAWFWMKQRKATFRRKEGSMGVVKFRKAEAAKPAQRILRPAQTRIATPETHANPNNAASFAAAFAQPQQQPQQVQQPRVQRILRPHSTESNDKPAMSAEMIARRSVQHGIPLFATRTRATPEPLEVIVRDPEDGSSPECTVIWLHGLGADAQDFLTLPQQLREFGAPAARFIFPNAPERELTVRPGYKTRAWYDLLSDDFGSPNEDRQGLAKMHQRVSQIINEIVTSGLRAERIFLGGFSMGAAMSLYSSVRQVRTLAGCIALSGYFPAADLLEKDVTPAGRGTPVFMAHGAFDSVIPSVLAEHGADLLENTLDTLIWREYNIDHEICQDELMNVAQFMSTALQR